ncbi:MAG: DUF2202 domain-containing protein [Bacteroidetes bacterium]|nr:DUF2202 domain-containing protein [Bacteroidota bacterium]MCB9225820.1 DUF2202 domain-containing protein [Chitinophagales bacterium]
MKKLMIFTVLVVITLSSISCNKDKNSLSEEEKAGLSYMLEEEKLARDVYIYLYNLWGINQFDNIKNSEVNHINSIATILEDYNINYNILPEGQFSNEHLQTLYNQLISEGEISNSNALHVGATIEDLDIVDLAEYINATSNTRLIKTYEKLQCGSQNHLRSFVSAIEDNGESYTPQFLTETEYNSILSNSHTSCN